MKVSSARPAPPADPPRLLASLIGPLLAGSARRPHVFAGRAAHSEIWGAQLGGFCNVTRRCRCRPSSRSTYRAMASNDMAQVTWLQVTWLQVTWLQVTWLQVTWLQVTWLQVTWLRLCGSHVDRPVRDPQVCCTRRSCT